MPKSPAKQPDRTTKLTGVETQHAPKNVPVAITDMSATAVREPVGGRAYVIVSLQTDAGVTGFGETDALPHPLAAVSGLVARKKHLIGLDALAAAAVRRKLSQAISPPKSQLLAAVDMALLDIMGKISRAPIYSVLGGPTRDKARGLARLSGSSTAEMIESVRRLWQRGYRAFLVPLPGADQGTRGPTFADRTYRLLERLRETTDEAIDFVLDGEGQLAPDEAASVARRCERLYPLWLNDPCTPASTSVLRKISEETSVPLGLGHEGVRSARFQELLREDCVDVVRPHISRYGISDLRKIAALAETYYVAVAPAHRGGPLGTAAALQLAASIPNFFIQEVPVPGAEADQTMRQELTAAPVEQPRDGFLPLPTGPGLGISIDPDSLQKYAIRS